MNPVILSCYSDNKGWGLILNGMPVAQGTYDECVSYANKHKIALPDYYWSGDLGKFLSYRLEPVNTLDVIGQQ